MGLLSKLGLKPTRAMLAGGGAAKPVGASSKAPAKEVPAQSPEMKSLIARFQGVMARIKALEAGQAPEAGALKKAAIAAGNLSTSPKGIVQAQAALDRVEAQIEDAKRKLAESRPTTTASAGGAPLDARNLASDARKRLRSLEARGRKAIAADPRNPNAGWLAEVVGNAEGRIVELERRGTKREADDVRKQLDWLEESVVRFEADAAEDSMPAGAPPDARKLASDARKRLRVLEARGRKAIAADPRNTNAGWLADVVSDFDGRIDELEQRGTKREADDVRKQLDWLEESVVRFEAEAAEDTAPPGASPDARKLASDARKRLKSLEARGRKAIAADPRNPNAGWLAEVVGNSEDRIVELEKRGTKREADDVRKQLDWLEQSVVRFETDAERAAQQTAGGEAGEA